MDQQSLESTLADLSLSVIRFFNTIGSTNDEAIAWVESGAPNRALVVANTQTSGRGRGQNRWITAPGSGLAFSLILLSPPLDSRFIARLPGLAAVAIRDALRRVYRLNPQIKWPNDILLNQQKTAGILVDAFWCGENLKAAIMGIGINIAPESVMAIHLSPENFSFPATSLEHALGCSIDRLECLHAILQELLGWLPRLSSPDLIREWEASLAYRQEWVELSYGESTSQSQGRETQKRVEVCKVMGLSEDGALIIKTTSGNLVTISAGDIHLKPAVQDMSSLPMD